MTRFSLRYLLLDRIGPIIAAFSTTALIGCGTSVGSDTRSGASEGSTVQAVSDAGDLGIFLVTPPIEVRHGGVRKVEVYDASGRLSQAHREEVFCDGRSRFSLKPLEALTQVPPDWEPRQRIREGFFFRYRDFEIRNAAKFRQNYSVSEVEGSASLLGRNCKLFQVDGRETNLASYRVWMDVATGLVLKFEKLDPNGNLRFSSAYESFDTNPDFSGTVWFESQNDEKPLDLALPLESVTGERVPYPRLLPAGFVLYEAFSLTSSSDSWFKQTYTDGVEPLFFLHQPKLVASGDPRGFEEDELQVAPTKPVTRGEGVLNIFEMGTTRVAQANLEEGTYCAVGSMDSQVLIDMIESALLP